MAVCTQGSTLGSSPVGITAGGGGLAKDEPYKK